MPLPKGQGVFSCLVDEHEAPHVGATRVPDDRRNVGIAATCVPRTIFVATAIATQLELRVTRAPSRRPTRPRRRSDVDVRRILVCVVFGALGARAVLGVADVCAGLCRGTVHHCLGQPNP